MQAVSQFFKEEKDFLFKRGEAIGAEKERAKAGAKMHEEKRNIAGELKKLGVSVAKISKSTGLSADEIAGL